MTPPTPHKIRLRDGRMLPYAEYGRPDGVPVVYCHGLPSSRVEGNLNINPAIIESLGARVIVPDRPGIGQSDHQPGRRIVDWPSDVGELTSHLGVGRFAVLGSSGGSAYALACGAHLPQVKAVGIVGGVAPLDVPGMLKSFSVPLRMMFRLGRSAPGVLNWLYRMNLRAIRRGGHKAGQRMAAMSPPPDRTLILERPEIAAGFMACFEEACRNGTRGPVTDTSLIARPWGVDLTTIPVPVMVWHGVQDRNVPVECAQYFARTIPDCKATFYPDDAHLSVPFNHQAEIFSALVAAAS
jgi:pimeloyl-ACP methyl ester carboxylesterase